MVELSLLLAGELFLLGVALEYLVPLDPGTQGIDHGLVSVTHLCLICVFASHPCHGVRAVSVNMRLPVVV